MSDPTTTTATYRAVRDEHGARILAHGRPMDLEEATAALVTAALGWAEASPLSIGAASRALRDAARAYRAAEGREG